MPFYSQFHQLNGWYAGVLYCSITCAQHEQLVNSQLKKVLTRCCSLQHPTLVKGTGLYISSSFFPEDIKSKNNIAVSTININYTITHFHLHYFTFPISFIFTMFFSFSFSLSFLFFCHSFVQIHSAISAIAYHYLLKLSVIKLQ